MALQDNLRDAAYVAIGLGVIGVQRAQVRREELRKQLDEAVRQAEQRLAPVIGAVEEAVRSATRRIP